MTARRFALFACLALAALAVLLGHGLARRESPLPPVPVEIVERRDVVVTIEASGVVEPIDMVEVKSKASGQILRMPVEVGSLVRSGDLLAQIDPVDVESQVDQARAAERAARARADISAAQKRRAEDLFAQQVITAQEHESAVLDFANAEAQLVKARTDLETAHVRHADATVRAPVAGTVLEQLVSAGQVITSATSSVSGGTPLLRMADLSRIRVRALVAETDIGSVRAGQAATVSVEAFPRRPFRGTVEKIEPMAVTQQSVTMFPVLISLSNESGLLLPGMNGEVSIRVDQREQVAAVSLDAVRSMREIGPVATALGMNVDVVREELARQTAERGESRRGSRDRSGMSGRREVATPAQFVFVRDDRGLTPRAVRLGLSDYDYVEILEGLEEGEAVELVSVAELQARRSQDQDRLRERLGSGMPGTAGGGARTPGSGRTGGR